MLMVAAASAGHRADLPMHEATLGEGVGTVQPALCKRYGFPPEGVPKNRTAKFRASLRSANALSPITGLGYCAATYIPTLLVVLMVRSHLGKGSRHITLCVTYHHFVPSSEIWGLAQQLHIRHRHRAGLLPDQHRVVELGVPSSHGRDQVLALVRGANPHMHQQSITWVCTCNMTAIPRQALFGSSFPALPCNVDANWHRWVQAALLLPLWDDWDAFMQVTVPTKHPYKCKMDASLEWAGGHWCVRLLLST